MKKSLSTLDIGITRFWTGLFLGIATSVTIWLLLTYGQHVWHAIYLEATVENDLMERHFHRIFTISLAGLIGTNTAQSIWFSKPVSKSLKDRIVFRSANNFARLIMWMSLLVTTRMYLMFMSITFGAWPKFPPFYTLIPILLWWIGVLLPMQPIMRKFKTRKWVLSILLANATLGIVAFPYHTLINLEPSYLKKHEANNDYVSTVLDRAQAKFGITFTAKEEANLREYTTPDSRRTATQLLVKLQNEQALSLKEIVALECVAFKKDNTYLYELFPPLKYNTRGFNILLWNQLELHPLNSDESSELLQCIREHITIISIWSTRWGSTNAHSYPLFESKYHEMWMNLPVDFPESPARPAW